MSIQDAHIVHGKLVDPDAIVLLKARQALADENNWLGGIGMSLRPSMGGRELYGPRKCMLIHIADVLGECTFSTASVDKIARKMGFSGYYQAYNFNDNPRTTHADVLACMDAAIARLLSK